MFGYDLALLAISALAVYLVGIAKGGFGGTVAMLGVPLMSLVTDPLTAAAILLPILCLMDLLTLWKYYGAWDSRLLQLMIPPAIVGIAIAALLFKYLSVNIIEFMLGILSIGYVGVFVINKLRHGKRVNPSSKPSLNEQLQQTATRWRGIGWCGLSGFTSTIAHTGGPPLSIFMLSLNLSKITFQASIVGYYFIVNYTKLIPYAYLSLLNIDNISLSLFLAPIAYLGIMSGIWLHQRVSDKLFFNIAYAALLIIGCSLIWGVLS